jgi:predicted CoA-binding protein
MSTLPSIFDSIHTIAIIGASSKSERASNEVMQYLLNQGFVCIPVNPNEKVVLGQKCYASLSDIPAAIALDVIDIFRKSDAVLPIIDQALKRNDAHTIWMQLGVENDEAKIKAETAGKTVIANFCIMASHKISREATE